MENRVVALSVLEDLLFWPLPARDGAVAAPDDFENADYLDDDELAMARLAAEENSLEPRAVREARYRAVLQLPLLCAKLGPRWTHAEVVPYLLRCLEEEDAPLTFAVGVVLLGLVRPHATTEAERDRLAKDRARPASAKEGTAAAAASSSATSEPPTASDSTYVFLTLDEAMPVVERLGACREERLRAFAAQVVVPHVCFGIPLEQGSVLEGWDRKYLLPVHMMQSLEDQQAGAVGGGGEEDGTDELDGTTAVVAEAAAAAASATAAHSSAVPSSSSSSSVRRAASSGAVNPRQRVLRHLHEVLEQYRQRAATLTEATAAVATMGSSSSSSSSSNASAQWTPLDYVYQRLGAFSQSTDTSSSGAGHIADKVFLEEGIYQTLFAMESAKLDQADDVHLGFLTRYLTRLADAGVGAEDDGHHSASKSTSIAKGGKEKLLLLCNAPLDVLGISYASDSFGNGDGGGGGGGAAAAADGASSEGVSSPRTGSRRDRGVAHDPFTLNVRARALTRDVVTWFDLVTRGTTSPTHRQITAQDYLAASSPTVAAALGTRWRTLETLLQRLLQSASPGAVAVGVEAIATLLHALTRALDFSRRTAAHSAAAKMGKRASSAAGVVVVGPPSVPLRLPNDAQLCHHLTTHLHLAFCAAAVVEAGLVASGAPAAVTARSTEEADNVWLRLSAALPVVINALYAQLYAHRVFLLIPVQMTMTTNTNTNTNTNAPSSAALLEWLVQFGPGPLEARVPMLATWDVAFATKTRTGQPDDVAVLLMREDEDDSALAQRKAAAAAGGVKIKDTTNKNKEEDAEGGVALSAETEADWRRGVAGIASAFRLPQVLRLSLLRCLPMLVSVEPYLGVAEAGGQSSRRSRASLGAEAEETPAATLDVVVRLLAQVIAPPAALPQLLSELLLTAAVLNDDEGGHAMAHSPTSATRSADAKADVTAPSPRTHPGLQRSRRASCFSPPASQLSMELPPASPRGLRAPRTQASATASAQAEASIAAMDARFVQLLQSPVLALAVPAAQTAMTASGMGESPASVDYALLEVVVASIEKTLTRAATLLAAELGSYVDALVSGRLDPATTAAAVSARVAAVVRLLFLLYQSCVRYVMVRASWKARWLLMKRLPSLTAGFLYVLISLAHFVASPVQVRHHSSQPSPSTAQAGAAIAALRASLQSVVSAYFGFTCELLTATWSGPHLGEAGVLFGLLSDDEAEVCYLSTHCLSGAFEELTQAALRLAASAARRDAHLRHQQQQQQESQKTPSSTSASAARASDKAELEAGRADFAAALAPFLAQLRSFSEVVVDGCRLNLADPLPRVRCGAVKGLARLSGVLAHVVAVTRFYESYRRPVSTGSSDGTEAWAEQTWADALTRTTQTLLSAMNDTSSVVQLTLVSELSHFLIRQGSEEQAAGQDVEASQQVRYEALLRCLDGLSRHDMWRYRERYAALLAEMCFCFLTSASASLQKLAKESLLPLLVNTLFDKVKAVRDAALAATTKLCARLYAIAAAGSVAADPVTANEFVNGTLWPIIYQTPRAWDTYLSRNALLQVALCLAVEKKGTMLPLLQKLAKDSVINVRLVVAKTVLQVLLADRGADGERGGSRSAQGVAGRAAASLQPAGSTTYELLMGKPPLFSTIRRIRPALDGPRRPGAASNTTRAVGSGATATGAKGDGGGALLGDSEGSLALPLVTFTVEEKNGVVLALLRELLEDSCRDVRDEAAKALHICF